MATQYEESLVCLVNLKMTRGERRRVHEQARARGMTLTAYVKHLIEQDRTPG